MSKPDLAKALELVNNLSDNTTNTEDLKLLNELKAELENLEKPGKFNKKTYVKILKELVKWALISERVIKEVIDLWTSDE